MQVECLQNISLSYLGIGTPQEGFHYFQYLFK